MRRLRSRTYLPNEQRLRQPPDGGMVSSPRIVQKRWDLATNTFCVESQQAQRAHHGEGGGVAGTTRKTLIMPMHMMLFKAERTHEKEE